MSKIDQTIFASDPKRPGNCLSACVATFLTLDLEQVPHFLEYGQWFGGKDDRTYWYCNLIGFMAAHGRQLYQLDDLSQAEPDEIVFVAGKSERGVTHQVLYRNGDLWHDPHPSRAGVLEVEEIEAWRTCPFDHTPSEVS